RLGCISCHDPHQLPTPQERIAYYRDQCLACHADQGCTLAANVRLQRSRDDDCIGCHMPRAGSSGILHLATTDHRIPRHAEDNTRAQSVSEKPDERVPAKASESRTPPSPPFVRGGQGWDRLATGERFPASTLTQPPPSPLRSGRRTLVP